MARGRKGQPSEVKEAKGNPGKRPTGEMPVDTLPLLKTKIPSGLTMAGRKVWADMAPKLQQTKLLRETDHESFKRYCDTVAEYWQVTRDLRKSKHVILVKTVAGGKMPRANPLFMIQDRLARRLDTMEDRFGLTPRARQEVMYRMAQSVPQISMTSQAGVSNPETGSPIGFLDRPGDDDGNRRLN